MFGRWWQGPLSAGRGLQAEGLGAGLGFSPAAHPACLWVLGDERRAVRGPLSGCRVVGLSGRLPSAIACKAGRQARVCHGMLTYRVRVLCMCVVSYRRVETLFSGRLGGLAMSCKE